MPSFMLMLIAIMRLSFALSALLKVRSSAAPIAALAIICDITIAFALIGQLRLGAVLSLVVAAAAFILAVIKEKDDLARCARDYLSPRVVTLFVACIVLAGFLHARSPLMSWWDEFSFWGMSAKLTKQRGAIYTYYKSSMLGVSIPPALPILSYLFQLFGEGFSEWTLFAAYDVLILCAACSVGGAFDRKERHMGVGVLALRVMLIFAFQTTGRISYLNPVFMTAYSDVPMAMLFARAVCMDLNSQEDGMQGPAAAPLAVLIMLTFTKDMGFALGLIAVFVIFFDTLLARKNRKFAGMDGIGAAFARTAVLGAGVLASFVIWSRHLRKVVMVNRTEFGGSESMGMVEMMLNGVKSLFIPSFRSEKYSFVMGEMISALKNRKVFMAGSGIAAIFFIFLVFLLAAVLSKDKNRVRSLSALCTTAIGFAGYYIFHLFLYVFVFRDDAYTLASYERYMQIYYLAWTMIALACLCHAAACDAVGGRLSRLAVIAMLAVSMLGFRRYLRFDNTFLMRDTLAYSDRLNVSAKVEQIKDVIGKDDVICCISNDDGGKWFIYTFELTDNYIIPDPGLLSPSEEDPKERITHAFKEYGVTHVLLDNTSREFEDMYGDLADTETGYIGLDAVGYYKVEYDDDGMVRLKSVKEVLSIADQN